MNEGNESYLKEFTMLYNGLHQWRSQGGDGGNVPPPETEKWIGKSKRSPSETGKEWKERNEEGAKEKEGEI